MNPAFARGFAIVPSHGRAHTKLPRFLEALRRTNTTMPGYIVVDEDDYAANNEAYDTLDLLPNWTVLPVRGGSCGAATEEALHALLEDDTDYVAWLSDDLVPETPDWDKRVIEALTGWNVVHTNDGHDEDRSFNGATAYSADVVRAAGGLYPVGCKHFFTDTMWMELGKMLNNITYLPEVMVRHLNPAYVAGEDDATTARIYGAWNTDEAAFLKWKNTERIAMANRIGQVLVDHGVSKALPDLSHIHVMIATPCGSGKYERLFVNSLWSTIDALRQCGATVNFAEAPYISDIALARMKLFGQFIRTDATHMLWIDDDMQWRASDVVRLFTYNRDFVAVAGPRKVMPPSFAVRVVNEAGQPVLLKQEAETGLFEVSHVGMAFTLITKSCAERVARAYPELECSGDDGRVEFAIFNSMVVRRRYMSEDFAFCERWRQVGGKVYVDPNISLGHVGAFVWEGSWMNHLISEANTSKVA